MERLILKGAPAKDIADAAQGRYFKLPKTNEAAIAELTQGAVGAMKA